MVSYWDFHNYLCNYSTPSLSLGRVNVGLILKEPLEVAIDPSFMRLDSEFKPSSSRDKPMVSREAILMFDLKYFLSCVSVSFFSKNNGDLQNSLWLLCQCAYKFTERNAVFSLLKL